MLPGTTLRSVLAEEGRKQSWLAAKAGIDQPTMSRIVNGHWNPDDETRAAIAAALCREVDELWPPMQEREAA